MLDRRDWECVKAHGIDPEAVEAQLVGFREGFPYLDVVRPASVGDGILRLDDSRLATLGRRYDRACGVCRVVKFVPASGAATRMFRELFGYLSSGEENRVTAEVLGALERFAFYDRLRRLLPPGASPEDVVRGIVGPGGLGYGNMPKALILFHRYPAEVRTALEEHLTEGAQYAACGGRVAVHFTVSPEHAGDFGRVFDAALPKYGERFGVEYDVTVSVQKSSTDTIAVNPDNTPFRNGDGSLLFRPAGHGALIENLNEMDADLVFIKNIDNVTTDSRRGDTVVYKKALAGLLLEVQEKIHGYLRMLEEETPAAEGVDAAEAFVRDILHVELPEGFGARAAADRAAFLCRVLDRPVRVCGMVRNEGEPGGGPFFARSADGLVSLQIAESSQIAPERREAVMGGATHFNPVDIVCGVRGPGAQIRPDTLCGPFDRIHLRKVQGRKAAEGDGAAWIVERCHVGLEHPVRRGSRDDLYSGKSGDRPASSRPSGVMFRTKTWPNRTERVRRRILFLQDGRYPGIRGSG